MKITALVFAILLSIPGSAHALGGSEECLDLQTQAELDLRSGSRCETDDECVAIAVRCPFGCEVLVNRRYYSLVVSHTQRYYVSCGACRESCTKNTSRIVCRNRECVREDGKEQ